MANIKSQIKRNRQNETRRQRNRAVRSEVKTRLRAADEAIEADGEDRDAKVRAAIRRVDSAAAKGVIHKNEAARHKSRLMAKVNLNA